MKPVIYENPVILAVIGQRVSDVLLEKAFHAMMDEITTALALIIDRELDLNSEDPERDFVLLSLTDCNRPSEHDYFQRVIARMHRFVEDFAHTLVDYDIPHANLCTCYVSNRRYAYDHFDTSNVGKIVWHHVFDLGLIDDIHDHDLRQRVQSDFQTIMLKHRDEIFDLAKRETQEYLELLSETR